MKSFGTQLIERNFSFKKRCEIFIVRDFYLIKSGNLKRVNFIFNNFYSIEGFKNRLIVLRDVTQINSTFEIAIFYSNYVLVSIEIY